MLTSHWKEVLQELDRWYDLGLKATFWIRDDDACEITEQLNRLQTIARRHHTSIALAVIPGKLHANLSHYLKEHADAFYPMCHGWKHINYGARNKPGEFGRDRPNALLIADATSAFAVFCEYFKTSNVIFVPPFNCISPSLVKALPGIGFSGISVGPGMLERKLLSLDSRLRWSPVVRIPASSGIRRLNVHVDLIDWRAATAREGKLIARDIARQLRFRRRGFVAAGNPIGLLTHHLAHNDKIWQTCDDVLDMLQSHKAVEFPNLAEWAA
jgi:hypothetical protein